MPASLGEHQPVGFGYWPRPEDDPGVPLDREPVRIVAEDGALVRGVLWTPVNGPPPKTAVILSHPRGDFSIHYACPLLAAAGYAVFGFSTRYLNNDTDCLHELCVHDVAAAAAEMKRRGYEAVVLLGNSGGGSLMAMTQAERQCGDGWIALAAHPGEGVFMLQCIDPSVADERDPTTAVPELDMYDPANGWRPWPEPCTYERDWLDVYRAAQRARVARLDETARSSLDAMAAAATRARAAEKGSVAWRDERRRALAGRWLVIHRTLADPAYLDPSIDPDDRPLGSLFAFGGDPHDANYARGGLSRVMSDRGWLSTWSGLSSGAKLADTAPSVTVPSLLIHGTADTEIRIRQAREVFDQCGADDKSYHELVKAPHYLEGFRTEAAELMIEWLRARFP